MGLSCSAQGRTVYECMRDERVSLSTLPEPGSRCHARQAHALQGSKANFWGNLGPIRGPMYRGTVKGQVAYSTRAVSGWVEVDRVVALKSPITNTAHYGLGMIGKPRWDVLREPFRQAARRTGVEEAWLRAVAHVESGYASQALSPKGAMGVMQLMPATATLYGVKDPFQARQPIRAGALHLAHLLRLYKGNKRLAAAAYNAGEGAVKLHGGVPPYPETQAYVERVETLYQAYRQP